MIFISKDKNVLSLLKLITFPHYPEKSPCSIVLGSHHNWKGNFHSVRSPWCPANKGGYPQISGNRNPFMWHQPWLPNGTNTSTRGKVLTSNYKRRKFERSFCWSSCHYYHQNPADVSVRPSRYARQQVCGCYWATLTAGHFTLGSSLTRSMWPSRSHDFWWFLAPRLTTSLSQRPLMLSWLPLLCVAQPPLCTVWLLLSHPTPRELTHCTGLGCSAYVWDCLLGIPMEGHVWSLLLLRSWRDCKGRARRCWKCDHVRTSGGMHCSCSWVYCSSTPGHR